MSAACAGLEKRATPVASSQKITEPNSGIRVITNAMKAMSAANGRPITRCRTKTTAALIDDRVTEPIRELPTEAVMRSVMSESVARSRAGARS